MLKAGQNSRWLIVLSHRELRSVAMDANNKIDRGIIRRTLESSNDKNEIAKIFRRIATEVEMMQVKGQLLWDAPHVKTDGIDRFHPSH